MLKPFVGSNSNKANSSFSYELSSQEAAIVVQTLEYLRFIINKEKSGLDSFAEDGIFGLGCGNDCFLFSQPTRLYFRDLEACSSSRCEIFCLLAQLPYQGLL